VLVETLKVEKPMAAVAKINYISASVQKGSFLILFAVFVLTVCVVIDRLIDLTR
jgi:hypothetical protein